MPVAAGARASRRPGRVTVHGEIDSPYLGLRAFGARPGHSDLAPHVLGRVGGAAYAPPVGDRIDRDYRSRPDGSSYAEQIEESGLRPRTELADVSTMLPSGEIAEALHLTEDDQVVRRLRYMFADDAPVQIAASYIPVKFAGGADIAYPDTGPSGIYARLTERGHGPVRFAEEIEVRRPTEEEARVLRIPEGQPVLEILRTAYASDGGPVEACSNVLAAYQWRLTYRWSQEP